MIEGEKLSSLRMRRCVGIECWSRSYIFSYVSNIWVGFKLLTKFKFYCYDSLRVEQLNFGSMSITVF